MPRELIFDVETTGFNADGEEDLNDAQEIIQFSYFFVSDGKIIEYDDIYFKSHAEYATSAISVHGLSKRKIDATSTMYFKDFLPKLKTLVDRCTDIVGHNVSFDIRQIYGYGDVELNQLINSKMIRCTMRDYPEFSFKTISGKDRGTATAWCKLSELTSKLINRGMLNVEDLEHEYYMLTGKRPKYHDALWDSFVTYKCSVCLEEIRFVNSLQQA